MPTTPTCITGVNSPLSRERRNSDLETRRGLTSCSGCQFASGTTLLVGPLAAAMLGASLGFLFWNFHPAKIFMGDGGAMFLGFMTATLGLKIRLPELPMATSWMIPVLILAVPIFDTTLVTISRLRRGLLPSGAPGKDHAAHRLANLGLGQRGAVLALYAVGVLGGLLALLISHMRPLSAFLLAGASALGALVAIFWLEHVPYEAQTEGSWKRHCRSLLPR